MCLCFTWFVCLVSVKCKRVGVYIEKQMRWESELRDGKMSRVMALA